MCLRRNERTGARTHTARRSVQARALADVVTVADHETRTCLRRCDDATLLFRSLLDRSAAAAATFPIRADFSRE